MNVMKFSFFLYGCAPLLATLNYQNIVNQL